MPTFTCVPDCTKEKPLTAHEQAIILGMLRLNSLRRPPVLPSDFGARFHNPIEVSTHLNIPLKMQIRLHQNHTRHVEKIEQRKREQHERMNKYVESQLALQAARRLVFPTIKDRPCTQARLQAILETDREVVLEYSTMEFIANRHDPKAPFHPKWKLSTIVSSAKCGSERVTDPIWVERDGSTLYKDYSRSYGQARHIEPFPCPDGCRWALSADSEHSEHIIPKKSDTTASPSSVIDGPHTP
jgi:hypothetical protein